MDLWYPVPQDWQAFERLVTSIANVHYGVDSAQQYGRQGQSQGGIDILVATDSADVGIQCKHFLSGFKIPALTEDCDLAAEHFSDSNERAPLTTFIAATTAPLDTHVQDEVRRINASSRYAFQVKVWFWDDINAVLNRSVVAAVKYQQSILQALLPDIVDDHKSCMRQAFDRHAFLDGFVDGEGDDRDFLKAMEDTDAFLSTGVLRDRSGNMLRHTLAATELPESGYRDRVLNLRNQVAGVVTLTRKLLNRPAMDRSDRLAVQAKVAKAYEAAQRLLQA